MSEGEKISRGGFSSREMATRVCAVAMREDVGNLQAKQRIERPVLLLYDTKSGAFGRKTGHKIMRKTPIILSFLFWQLKVSLGGQ